MVSLAIVFLQCIPRSWRFPLKCVNDVLTVSKNSASHFLIVLALEFSMYFDPNRGTVKRALRETFWSLVHSVLLTPNSKLTTLCWKNKNVYLFDSEFYSPQDVELPYSLSFLNFPHSKCHTNLKSVIRISTYSTAPLSFRSIFKEKGSFLNSTE